MFTRIFRLCQRPAAAMASAVMALVVTAAMLATMPARAQTPAAHKAFVLIEYQVRDKPLFEKLRDQVRESLKTYKGTIVTREKVAPIFGSTPTNLSVIGFASIDAARTWLASKDMVALASQRDKAAEVSTYLVEKLD